MSKKVRLSKELEEELKERHSDEGSGNDDHEDGTHESIPSSRPGRSALPECWSRLVHVKPVGPSNCKIFSIFTDIELQTHLRTANQRLTKVPWSMLFYPKQFAAENEIADLESFALPEQQLKRYAL